jgi:prefoldin subunit 5
MRTTTKKRVQELVDWLEDIKRRLDNIDDNLDEICNNYEEEYDDFKAFGLETNNEGFDEDKSYIYEYNLDALRDSIDAVNEAMQDVDITIDSLNDFLRD